MSAETAERPSNADGDLAETIRTYRWYVLLVALELVLGALAVTLELLAPEASGENTIHETIAGMIGGWMLILAITAVALFVVVRVFDLMEDTDDHYLDYLES